jgi:hypothetical protein
VLLGQQARVLAALDQVGDLAMSWVGSEAFDQVAGLLEVAQPLGDVLAALEHVALGPGPAPGEPVAVTLSRPSTTRPNRSSRPPPSMPTTATSQRSISASR